jgi:Ca-activated chloride channel family protein
LLLLGVCLAAALLFWLLGFGRPQVAVAIALDLSPSTYNAGQFNAPGTIMNQEVQAVQAYLDRNQNLRQPNQVYVFGFASGVKPLTNSFQDNSTQVAQELTQALQPNLVNIIGGGTDLNLAIQEGIRSLSKVSDRCRELLLVTDGEASVSPAVISEAALRRIKINAVVLGAEALELRGAALGTGGIYLSGEQQNLEQLFTKQFFAKFNTNWRWLLLWLGLAWICLMWTLTMPLDRWLFQGLLKMPFNLAGRLALGHALFWTAATPGIVWSLYRLLNLTLPFISQC